MSDIFPRQNSKSTLVLDFIRMQKELDESNYKNYIERFKNDSLKQENEKLKGILKDLRELIGNNFINPKMRLLLIEVDKIVEGEKIFKAEE